MERCHEMSQMTPTTALVAANSARVPMTAAIRMPFRMMFLPSLTTVVRRRAPREPAAEPLRAVSQLPFVEDGHRHRPQAAARRAGRGALLHEPRLEGLGLGVGG